MPDLDDQLRSALRDETWDLAVPVDAMDRLRAGTRRRRTRNRVAGVGLAVAALAGGGVLVAQLQTDSRETITPIAMASAPETPTGVSTPGPSDAELRAAPWFGVTSKDGTDVQTVWRSRDGRALLPVPGGAYVKGVGPEQSPLFSGLTFEQVLALPTDPTALRAALVPADAEGDRDVLFATFAFERLTSSPVTEPVRKALVDLLEATPSITSATDASGQLVLTRHIKGEVTISYVIDQPSSRVVQERQVTDADGAVSTRTYVGWPTELAADAVPYLD